MLVGKCEKALSILFNLLSTDARKYCCWRDGNSGLNLPELLCRWLILKAQIPVRVITFPFQESVQLDAVVVRQFYEYVVFDDL